MSEPKEADKLFDGNDIREDEAKRPFVEPKLSYVEPELVRHGDMAEVTGFFGPFSP